MSCASLFPLPPTITFHCDQDRCPHCQHPLKVFKTKSRDVITLHIGKFHVQETISTCGACGRTCGSEQLRRLVPSGSNFGYDIMVYVGRALFIRHRRSHEIRDELAARNVRISPSEVEYLGKKFIVYLAIAHQQAAPRIQHAMRCHGGYILHLDATCDGKDPLLMSSLDSITQIVLDNVKMPSEKADTIAPFLREIKQLFGDPAALVHDMGSGIIKAVNEVFPNIPDFICHYHFLRDVGKDLLGPDYEAIRKRLDTHEIAGKLRAQARRLKQRIDDHPELIEHFAGHLENPTASDSSSVELIPAISAYGLILWALNGKNQGRGYGFPFDRPHLVFAQRLRVLHEHLQEIKVIQLRGQWRDNRPLTKLSHELEAIVADRVLGRTVAAIEPKIQMFDELRDAMRIAPASGSDGLNCDGMDEDIRTIESDVRKFRRKLDGPKYASNQDYQAMIQQIDKYWKKLFADPMLVDTPDGKVQIQPQRTNNLMERFFRDFKTGHRRKSGHHAMNKTLQAMLADTPLVKNLENEAYMQILLSGKDTLEALFADIDILLVRKQLKEAQKGLEKIPAKIRKIVGQPQLPQRIAHLFRIPRPRSVGQLRPRRVRTPAQHGKPHYAPAVAHCHGDGRGHDQATPTAPAPPPGLGRSQDRIGHCPST